MNQELKHFFDETKAQVEAHFLSCIEQLNAPESLKKSMLYSLEAGGKRLRPVLFMATLKSFGKQETQALDLACVIEMLHTYSLIHDDLPAMDDDDLRRGKPTNHKVFGEALAILAGDALLTYSFQLLADFPNCTNEQKIRLVSELAKATGPEGMVGGQVDDMEGERKELSVEELEMIHHRKTGDLLTFAAVAGAIVAEASEHEVEATRQFARELGLLFQIKDDILDVEGDSTTIGKPVGSDDTNNKSTYPSLLGLNGAKQVLEVHTQKALKHLAQIRTENQLLEELTNYVSRRDR